jgi:hypothetical protein
MRVHHDLMTLSREEYARVLRRYVADVSQAFDVMAVFQFGEVTEPGLSDLDLLVVVRDEVFMPTLRSVIAACRVDRVAKYLFAHPPVVVPQMIAGDVAWIHTFHHLHQVWGDPVEIPRPPLQAQAVLRLAEYVDFAFAVRTVLRGLSGADVGLRELLLLLKSCLHSLRLAASITGRPAAAAIEERLAQLREQSLASPDSDGTLREASAAARECVEALREADRAFEMYLTERGIVRAVSLREYVCYLDGRFYRFEAPFAVRDVLESVPSAPGWWKRLGVDPSVEAFPGFYLAQFAAYGTGTGLYASTHRAVFGRRAAELIVDPTYRSVLQVRLQIVQRVYDVVGPAGLIPMVPLGVGFRAPERIRLSRRRRLLRGAVARASAAEGR